MTIREITDKILEYHPQFDEDYDGCDDAIFYMYMNHPIIPHRIIRTGERDLRTRSMRRKKHF